MFFWLFTFWGMISLSLYTSYSKFHDNVLVYLFDMLITNILEVVSKIGIPFAALIDNLLNAGVRR